MKATLERKKGSPVDQRQNEALVREAIEGGRNEELAVLIARGLEDAPGCLQLAIANGGIGAVRIILSAFPGVVDLGETPPIFEAIRLKRRPEIIALLVEHKADPSVKNHLLQTPLHLIAQNDAFDGLVDLFLEKKALVDAQDTLGSAPLHAASKKANIHAVDALLKRNADPSAMNRFGFTPLQIVVLRSDKADHRLAIVKMLFQRGALPFNISRLFSKAVRGHLFPIAEVFVGTGASVHVSFQHGTFCTLPQSTMTMCWLAFCCDARQT